jgi:hypothetical protein
MYQHLLHSLRVALVLAAPFALPPAAAADTQRWTLLGPLVVDADSPNPGPHRFSIPVHVPATYALSVRDLGDGDARVVIFVDDKPLVRLEEPTRSLSVPVPLEPGIHRLRVLLTAGAVEVAVVGSRPIADLGTPRSGHTATVLGDGRLLLAGGRTATGLAGGLEILDANGLPSADALTSLAWARVSHSATLLPRSQALLIGGKCCARQLMRC